jgi:hypothetical protein
VTAPFRFCTAALFILVSFTGRAQGVWDNPFDSTQRTHERKAWTFSVGTSQAMGIPSSHRSSWILNHGTLEAPLLDTLHLGVWTARPRVGWRAGFGHLWLREDPLWADRISTSLHVSSTRIDESFLGEVKGVGADTSVAFVDELLWASAQATAVDLDVQAMRAVATGPDGFLELRAGLRAACHLTQTDPTPDPRMFEPARLPTWHAALTLGLGAGLKVYRGRMVRLTVDVDALQLAQARTDTLLRVLDSDVRGLDWLQGGYRPWRVTLHHDLYRRKPEQGCAAPTRSTASKTLFDPKMSGTGKAKYKGLKKAMKVRED